MTTGYAWEVMGRVSVESEGRSMLLTEHDHTPQGEPDPAVGSGKGS